MKHMRDWMGREGRKYLCFQGKVEQVTDTKKKPRGGSVLSVTFLAGVSWKECKLKKEDFCIYFEIFYENRG